MWEIKILTKVFVLFKISVHTSPIISKMWKFVLFCKPSKIVSKNWDINVFVKNLTFKLPRKGQFLSDRFLDIFKAKTKDSFLISVDSICVQIFIEKFWIVLF